MTAPIRLYWWRPTRPYKSFISELISHPGAWARLAGSGGGMRNFGDEVGRDIVEALSHRKTVWSPIERADVASVGSILNSVLKRGSTPVVFGSGLREPVDVSTIERLPEFISVRGDLTRSALGLSLTLPTADPGLVASELYPSTRSSGAPRPVFIPHFAMLGTRAGRDVISQFRSRDWKIALPNLTPREMASTISSAALIVTTSLHAIVFAHSYGVPVAKLRLAEHAGEPEFKYSDYASALGASISDLDLSSALTRTPGDIIDGLSPSTTTISERIPTLIESVYTAGRALA